MLFGGEPTGFVFDIKRYSIHDGPGIRTTFFLKGCPLSCWWCHNPEGISPLPAPLYHRNRCIGCGRCARECPQGARSAGKEGILLDASKCTECGFCEKICPSLAIEFAGKEMTVPRILQIALKDLLFYDESGGGVTFSGGEPLMQPGFLIECLKALRRAEISTALDTSGFCSEEDLLRAADEADLFLFDIKLIDPVQHEHYTGVSNARILSNLKSLDRKLHKEGKKAINIRIPLIPGVNDSPENLDAVADLILSLRSVVAVNVLPYHSIGSSKYKNLGMEFPATETPAISERHGSMFNSLSYADRLLKMQQTKPPTDREVAEVLSQFASRGVRAVKGG